LEMARLARVCRRWRYLILASPRYLRVRLVATYSVSPRIDPDRWPTFPISIIYKDRTRQPVILRSADVGNVVEVIQHTDRFTRFPSPCQPRSWKIKCLGRGPVLRIKMASPSVASWILGRIHFPFTPYPFILHRFPCIIATSSVKPESCHSYSWP
ncbi:hypothetical protein F5148DRAFT_1158790, partial [Russula earlei]